MVGRSSISSSSRTSYIVYIFITLSLIISIASLILSGIIIRGHIFGNLDVGDNLDVGGNLDVKGNVINKGSVFMRGYDDNKPSNLVKYPSHTIVGLGQEVSLTVGNILSGVIIGTGDDPGNVFSSAYYMPSAKDLVEAINGVEIGDTIEFSYLIDLNAADDYTVRISKKDNSGVTLIGYMYIQQNQIINTNFVVKERGLFRIRFTNVHKGDESYTVYRIA